MPTYILDTGVLLGYVRGAPWAAYIDKTYAPSKPPNLATISVVTQGELYSLASSAAGPQQNRASSQIFCAPSPPLPLTIRPFSTNLLK